MTTQELTETVKLLLAREEEREARQQRQRQKQVRHRRKEMEASLRQLSQSIEVIKWCIVGITSFMALALIVLVLVVMEVQREAERIKSEVQQIQREAEAIRDKIRHPLESLGGLMGRRLEDSINDALGRDTKADD